MLLGRRFKEKPDSVWRLKQPSEKCSVKVLFIATSDPYSANLVLNVLFFLCKGVSVHLLMFGMFEKPSVPLATLQIATVHLFRGPFISTFSYLSCFALTASSSVCCYIFHSKLQAAKSQRFNSPRLTFSFISTHRIVS